MLTIVFPSASENVNILKVRGLSEVGRVLSARSAASIVSEGSVGSFSNESTTQLDYSRLKSEHRKLQKHLEVFFKIYCALSHLIIMQKLKGFLKSFLMSLYISFF